ncbi:CapA family protein [Nocardioides renjunii]|uniref:CapA family protein n=1 Tax=Nocardioides renjunii TaxID=3095075 RepID=UPI002AFE1635|nr:CapA family protein [Nocardioides sp. S-34]WQQ21441.1 CapA family protein [Nocardioides sp. S-34]
MDVRAWGGAAVAALALVACSSSPPGDSRTGPVPPQELADDAVATPASPRITLAFAGDVHFEAQLQRLLPRQGALGPVSRAFKRADVAMVNLETPVTDHPTRDPKELEAPGNRYHFRTSPQALDVLADAGVDVVSVANNHAGDYGQAGLADTLVAGRAKGVAMVGAGRDLDDAFTPHRVSVDGVDVAFLAADAVFREGRSRVWAAGADTPGLAAARETRPDALLAAVETAADAGDVVVVYLHWGLEQQACPSQRQRLLARNLAEAGADVVVGSHSHVVGGSGWSGDTYVGYGLGNFLWYHDRQPGTGVLTLTVDRDGVVGDAWAPARIAPGGKPRPLTGTARSAAVAVWQDRRRCTGLAATRGEAQAEDPAYSSTIQRIDADLRRRMRTSHGPGCPVPLRDLRYLRMTHRDFDGRARTGEMVVHRRFARGVTGVFRDLYDAGWPIARMRLVDDYGGDDDRSMAANNSSGFNCRRVAGQQSWSDHAYGAAIDLNPVQNPYVRPGSIAPPAGRRYAAIDRGSSAPVPPGVIRVEDLPVEAFARLGWGWGGYWVSSKDWQHVAAPVRPAPSRPAPPPRRARPAGRGTG